MEPLYQNQRECQALSEYLTGRMDIGWGLASPADPCIMDSFESRTGVDTEAGRWNRNTPADRLSTFSLYCQERQNLYNRTHEHKKLHLRQ